MPSDGNKEKEERDGDEHQTWDGTPRPIPFRSVLRTKRHQRSETLTTSTCEGASFLESRAGNNRTQTPNRDSWKKGNDTGRKGRQRKNRTEIETLAPSPVFPPPNFPPLPISLPNLHAFQLMFEVRSPLVLQLTIFHMALIYACDCG
ncbi:hypothetical protein ACFX1T_041914 [Malus domestica]